MFPPSQENGYNKDKQQNMSQKVVHHHVKKLHQKAKETLAKKHPKGWAAASKKTVGSPVDMLVNKTGHLATTAALAGTLIANKSVLTAEQLTAKIKNQNVQEEQQITEVTQPQEPKFKVLQRSLTEFLPTAPKKLATGTSAIVSKRIYSILNIRAKTELDGFALNTDYGYMGAEQHLPRFPGDTISKHDQFQESGITRSRGAFGYFSPSEAALTQEAIMQEKYYVVVQSFLSPAWNKNSHQFKDWLKFRKVLVVNPNTGKAVVGVVGDAGPALWTGKQFGGSPEIIRHLNSGKHTAKTTVLVLFVDDPNNEIPLGPVGE